MEPELLSGENQYDAEGFGKQDALKGLAFHRLPPVLNLLLKRFEYDPYADGMVKVRLIGYIGYILPTIRFFSFSLAR